MDNGNHPANSDTVIPLTGRRPGRPKGLPKPPNSGRQKGVRNHVSRDVKELALNDAPKMLAGLKKLALEAVDERTRLAAITAYLDRAYGRPVQATELTGKDGAPLDRPSSMMSDLEAVRRIRYLMDNAKKAETAKSAAEIADDRETAKAIAFTTAVGAKLEELQAPPAEKPLDLTPEMIVPINKPQPWHSGDPQWQQPQEAQPTRQWPTPDEQELLRAQRQEDRAFERGNAPRVIMGRHR